MSSASIIHSFHSIIVHVYAILIQEFAASAGSSVLELVIVFTNNSCDQRPVIAVPGRLSEGFPGAFNLFAVSRGRPNTLSRILENVREIVLKVSVEIILPTFS
jgi:hypothetical protein